MLVFLLVVGHKPNVWSTEIDNSLFFTEPSISKHAQ